MAEVRRPGPLDSGWSWQQELGDIPGFRDIPGETAFTSFIAKERHPLDVLREKLQPYEAYIKSLTTGALRAVNPIEPSEDVEREGNQIRFRLETPQGGEKLVVEILVRPPEENSTAHVVSLGRNVLNLTAEGRISNISLAWEPETENEFGFLLQQPDGSTLQLRRIDFGVENAANLSVVKYLATGQPAILVYTDGRGKLPNSDKPFEAHVERAAEIAIPSYLLNAA
jgi:hypothetical protein